MDDHRTADVEQPHFGDYVAPVLARKWLIIVIVVVATLGTYLYYDRQTPEYVTSTKIFLGRDNTDPIGGVGVSFGTDRDVQNQATLLTSQSVVASVAKRIGYTEPAGTLASKVTAVASEGSDFVSITARSSHPGEAARIANGFADAFVLGNAAKQRAQVTKTLKALQSQLDRLPPSDANEAERANIASGVRRYKLALRLGSGSGSQVEKAAVPGAPTSPKPGRSALFAFVLSLVAGLAAAFGLERFDRRLKHVEDASAFYALPVLATLPHDPDNDYVAHGLCAVSPNFKEAFRALRSNLQLAALDSPPRRILVTSGLPGEGKSTVIRNLAIIFREWGDRVAVVDCDLRAPSLAALFHAELEGGFTDVLTGERGLAEVMTPVGVEAPGLDTLDMIQAGAARGPARPESSNGHHEAETDPFAGITLIGPGRRPSNPTAVLSADRTQQVLQEISAHHDVVLIDSPPLLAVTDTVPLISQVDAVILVTRLGLTTKDSATRVTELLARIPDAPVLGIVVNDLAGLEARAYGRKYGYGYGERVKA